MMKNWKKMIVTASALASLALFAGCTTASAVSLEEAKALVQERMGAGNAVVIEQETDRDDGVYELEIIIDGVGYEFEVDSRTGAVREMERDDDRPAAPVETAPAQTAPARTITLEEAKAIAYAHAGVSESDAYDRSYERDDGVFEIDFEHDGWEYDYDIAPDGTILKSEKEPERAAAAAAPAETAPVQTAPARTITLEEAKAIAYAHAGVSESDAYDRSYERDDGVFEIDFEHDGWEYDYDISPDGTILKSGKEPDGSRRDDHDDSRHTSADTTQPARITAEEALSIAMAHAGVTDARDREVEWDDGRWEVSFESGRTDYEYDISADGTVLRWEKDNDD